MSFSPKNRVRNVFTFVFAWTGKVVGVSGGDTIKVLHNGKQVKLRLYGIDTPEKKQAYGQTAKKITSSLVIERIILRKGMTFLVILAMGNAPASAPPLAHLPASNPL